MSAFAEVAHGLPGTGSQRLPNAVNGLEFLGNQLKASGSEFWRGFGGGGGRRSFPCRGARHPEAGGMPCIMMFLPYALPLQVGR